MTTLAGRTIAALRDEHDTLASTARGLSAEQLTVTSGASDWRIADVLSHLGSGAEIMLTGFQGSPGPDLNAVVWDRWNSLSPQEQAAGWERSDEALVAALEAIPLEQHETLRPKVGFLPDPLPLASFAALRLSEVVQHGWDVHAGLDPAAALPDNSAELLAEHLSGGVAFLLGFVGKPAEAPSPAVIEISGTPYRIVLDDAARLTTDAAPATATFHGPLEAALRLIYGRLTPPNTPAGVDVTGNITLDQLRAVFPGF
jgi:uncharacterized protein (TIGR03083 family)